MDAAHSSSNQRLWFRGIQSLERALARLNPPAPYDDNLYGEQHDHERQHAGDTVALRQPQHDERRYDRRRTPDRVADAVGTQPYLGREQLRGVDAKQERNLNIDRDDQQKTNRQNQPNTGGGRESSIDHAEPDGEHGRADDGAPSPKKIR